MHVTPQGWQLYPSHGQHAPLPVTAPKTASSTLLARGVNTIASTGPAALRLTGCWGLDFARCTTVVLTVAPFRLSVSCTSRLERYVDVISIELICIRR